MVVSYIQDPNVPDNSALDSAGLSEMHEVIQLDLVDSSGESARGV